MLADARRAFRQLLSPPFRAILWKSIGLTILLAIAVIFAAQLALQTFLAFPFPWLETAVSIVTGVGLFVGLGFLIAPVTSIFAGLFLDEIAGEVERVYYPYDRPGRPMPLGPALLMTVKFTAIVILVNLFALMLLLLPGINIAAFFLANGYLLGREYFQFAALRFHDEAEVRQLRKIHGGTVFLGGLLIAGVLSVPILNLATPLFATALMVHVHKRLTGSEPVKPYLAGR